MDLDATQRFVDEPDTNDTNVDNPQVGILRIGSTDHPIVKGLTKIGRSPILSAILVNDISVSKVHAEIEASAEKTFICDLRSSNGTKIQDLPLQPFRYYTIDDGDRIYLGTVQGIFTTSQSNKRKAATLRETEIPSGISNENITPSKISRSFNDSSSFRADDSVVPGTQPKDRTKVVFQRPAVPVNASKSRSIRVDPFTKNVPSREEKSAIPPDEDLHDMETLDFDSYLPLVDTRVSGGDRKREKNIEEHIDENIHEAETQVLIPPEPDIARDKKSRNIRKINMSDIAEQSSGDFSRELRLSRSPSPANALEQSDDIMQSQDLLQMSETPLLQHGRKSWHEERKTETKTPNDSVKRSNEKQSRVSSKENTDGDVSIASRHVIADSDDECPTDDITDAKSLGNSVKDTKKRNEAAHVSDEIDDDSSTDDEGEFASLASLSSSKARPKISLKLSRSKITDDRITETNIFEAATQPMIVEPPRLNRSKQRGSVPPVELEIDADIDLMPTQIFDVANSTPIEKSRKRIAPPKSRVAIEDDIYMAETQISIDDFAADDNPTNNTRPRLDDSISKNSTPIEKSRKRIAPPKSRVAIEDDIYMAETQISIDDFAADDNPTNNTRPRLDDSISKNLGAMFGEEQNKNQSLEDEPTQLLTQNLVDILNPTQFHEDSDDEGPSRSKKSKIASDETRGSVGRTAARDAWSDALPRANSTMNDNAHRDQGDKSSTKAPRMSEIIDDDDFFADLPKFTISGTLSNPASPAPSAGSDSDELFVDKTETKTPLKTPLVQTAIEPQRNRFGRSAKPAVGVVDPKYSSVDSDSDESIVDTSTTKTPVVETAIEPRRTRFGRSSKTVVEAVDPKNSSLNSSKLKKKSKNTTKDVIANSDSDEEIDYNDLRTMADCLLASMNHDFARSRKKLKDSVSSMKLRETIERKIVSRKVSKSNRRGHKLPQTPSSLIVSDGKKVASTTDDKVSSSSAESPRASTRRSKTSLSLKSTSSSDKQAQSVESQEIETILAVKTKENIPVVEGKSVPKLILPKIDGQLTDDAGYRNNDRKRRATVNIKDVTQPPKSPAVAKNRRTVAVDGGDSRILPKEQHKIMVTGLSEDYSKIVKKLGGAMVVEPSQATILISDRVRRTYKFLCAVAKGLRVVSIKWLTESMKVNRFLDCDDFTLKDVAGEKQYRFKLEKSLQTSRTTKFLEGYSILVTPKVNQPDINELKSMITESGGKYLARAPAIRAWNSKTVIISRDEDIAAAKALLAKAPKSVEVTVQTVEFILTGILRQEVNLHEHKLNIS